MLLRTSWPIPSLDLQLDLCLFTFYVRDVSFKCWSSLFLLHSFIDKPKRRYVINECTMTMSLLSKMGKGFIFNWERIREIVPIEFTIITYICIVYDVFEGLELLNRSWITILFSINLLWQTVMLYNLRFLFFCIFRSSFFSKVSVRL